MIVIFLNKNNYNLLKFIMLLIKDYKKIQNLLHIQIIPELN